MATGQAITCALFTHAHTYTCDHTHPRVSVVFELHFGSSVRHRALHWSQYCFPGSLQEYRTLQESIELYEAETVAISVFRPNECIQLQMIHQLALPWPRWHVTSTELVTLSPVRACVRLCVCSCDSLPCDYEPIMIERFMTSIFAIICKRLSPLMRFQKNIVLRSKRHSKIAFQKPFTTNRLGWMGSKDRFYQLCSLASVERAMRTIARMTVEYILHGKHLVPLGKIECFWSCHFCKPTVHRTSCQKLYVGVKCSGKSFRNSI